MTWRVTAVDRLPAEHHAAWDGLNAQRFGGHPLLDSRLVQQQSDSEGRAQHHLCMLERDGVVVAMCLLQRMPAGVWRCGTGDVGSLGPALLAEPADLPGLAEVLPGRVSRIDLHGQHPVLSRLGDPGPLPSRPQREAAGAWIDLTTPFADYAASRRALLADADATSHQITAVVTPDEVAEACRRWAALPRTAAPGPGPALALRHAAIGQCRVLELRVDGRLTASMPVIVQGRVVLPLAVHCDPSAALEPARRALLAQLLPMAFANWPGLRLDLLLQSGSGAEGFADACASVQQVTIYPNRGWAWFWHRRPSAPADGDAVATELQRSVDALPADMLALMARAEHQDVSFGPTWFRLFSQTVMKGVDGVRLLTVRRAGRPLAVVPLNSSPALRQLGGAVGALSNYYTSLYGPALAEGVTGVDLAAGLRAARPEFGRHGGTLSFAPMDPQSAGYAALMVGLRLAGYAVFDYFSHGNWYLPVDSDWPTYLAGRPGELRSTIRRMTKKLLAEGARIELVSAPEHADAAMQAFQKVYAQSWKKPEPVPDFMPELARTLARQGWLRLGVVWLGDQPIAAQIWTVVHGRAGIFKLAYDEAFKRYAAGTVLTAHLMEHAMAVDRVREIDYLIGDDGYKKQWMTHRRERRGLVAYDLHTATGLLGATREVLGRALKRQTPVAAPDGKSPAAASTGATAPTT